MWFSRDYPGRYLGTRRASLGRGDWRSSWLRRFVPLASGGTDAIDST
jgi:hypothetical protein